MRGARLGEALFGAALLGLGLFAIYRAGALPIGTVREPDAGLFPISIAVVLTLLAALSLGTRKPTAYGVATERLGIARVAALAAALAAYAWLLPRVGFIVCTIALLVLTLRGLGRVGWVGTIISSALGALGCYFLFTQLGLPLPAGWLGF